LEGIVSHKNHNHDTDILFNQLLLPGVLEITSPCASPRGDQPRFSQNELQKISSHKLLIVTVGLPGRGKTFMAQKLGDYLNWLGYRAQVFNVCEHRRKYYGSFFGHDWFRSDNLKVFLKTAGYFLRSILNDVI
jgi:hypothetical protein